MTVLRATATVVLGRLEYLVTNPWLIGTVALLSLSFGAIVVTNAKVFLEYQERSTLELQQRLRATLQSAGPSGRQVDRALRVIRPPSAAAVLIAGQESTMPAGWDMGPATIETLPPYAASTSTMRLGSTADGTAFVGQFGGLLALGLGLISVLRDRRRGWGDAERGTATPVPVFWIADVVAASMALAIVVCIWFGMVWLLIHNVLNHPWEEATQTIWMVAFLTWCYLVALYGYGAAIGWYVAAPYRAVASAAMLWVLLGLLGPQMVTTWVNWTWAVPSRARVEQSERDAYTDRVRELEADMGRQVASQVADAPTSSEKERRARLAFEALEPAWIRQMAEARAEVQTAENMWRVQSSRLAIQLQRAARFTPVTLLPQALAEVSGTGITRRTRWHEQVDDYKRRLDLAVFDDRPTVPLRLPINGSIQAFGYVRHPLTPFHELPQFVAPMITAHDRWQAASGDILLLLLHALVGLGLAGLARWRSWRRYDFASVSAADVGIP